jgi:sodium transport system permease protein
MKSTTLSAWRAIRIVFKKEIKDGIRDRRSILMALSFLIMGPLLIVWVFSIIADVSKEPEYITLPTIGAKNAPELVLWLKQNGVKIVAAPANPKEKVRDASIDMALRIPGNYSSKNSSGYPAEVELIMDSTSRKQGPSIRKVSRLVKEYSGRMGSLRLIARGINPVLANPVVVKKINVANNMAIVAKILSIIPMLIILAVFIYGMGLAIDTTAGERERRSLESLLLSPIPRWAIVTGKWLATFLFSAVGAILTIVGCLGVLSYIPIEELGFNFSADGKTVVGMIAAALPLALMGSALMLLIATFARSFKEANITMQIPILLAMVPTFIDSSGASEPWMFVIPVFAQHRIITDVLAGTPPSLAMYILSGTISLALAIGAVWLTSRLFNDEKIIFGR